ncbi:MAG: hypothetical protein AAFV97_03800 [Bacteroidota bacterium]
MRYPIIKLLPVQLSAAEGQVIYREAPHRGGKKQKSLDDSEAVVQKPYKADHARWATFVDRFSAWV